MAVRITRAGVALTVGIILVTGLIIGGFFLARQSSEQARRNEAIKVAEQNLQGLSNEDTALNEGEENNSSNESTNESSSEGATDSEESTSTDSNGTSSTDSATDTAQNNETVSELPATGPEAAASVIAIAALAFSITAYVQSRRSLQ